MEKQIYPHNGILKEEPCNRHLPQYEWISKNMLGERSQTYKTACVAFHLHEMSRIGKTIEAKSRQAVAEGGSED